MNNFAKIIASMFYVGKLPIAPGTWGSLAAFVIWLLIIPHISSYTLIVLILVLFGFGVIISSHLENTIDEKDPSIIVIDEWVGQWIALLFLPKSIIWGTIAFLLFRLFDIWKPFPANKLDKLNGGWGIMLDDVMAGIYSLLIVQILRFIVL